MMDKHITKDRVVEYCLAKEHSIVDSVRKRKKIKPRGYYIKANNRRKSTMQQQHYNNTQDEGHKLKEMQRVLQVEDVSL